jgi:hypothetical protein
MPSAKPHRHAQTAIAPTSGNQVLAPKIDREPAQAALTATTPAAKGASGVKDYGPPSMARSPKALLAAASPADWGLTYVGPDIFQVKAGDTPICLLVGGDSVPEIQGNAILLAASKRFLAALDQIADMTAANLHEAQGTAQRAIDLARRTLADAEGAGEGPGRTGKGGAGDSEASRLSAHTKGPWLVQEGHARRFIIQGRHFRTGTDICGEPSEREANAVVMAAGPTFLTALERIAAMDKDTGEPMRTAQAAISAAQEALAGILGPGEQPPGYIDIEPIVRTAVGLESTYLAEGGYRCAAKAPILFAKEAAEVHGVDLDETDLEHIGRELLRLR